jgi:hypothetical protein
MYYKLRIFCSKSKGTNNMKGNDKADAFLVKIENETKEALEKYADTEKRSRNNALDFLLHMKLKELGYIENLAQHQPATT